MPTPEKNGPKEKALQYQVIPMFKVKGELTLATTDPNAIFVFDEVEKITGLRVHPVLCRADDIMDANPVKVWSDAAEKNLEMWQSMHKDFMKAFGLDPDRKK